jgi:uncharacterized YigZ family protein
MSAGGWDIPGRLHRIEASIERSRFITTLAHAPDPAAARTFIDAVRTEFPDATHNCWAYVAGSPGTTAHIGMSDAGEPHGTAGRPMLDVLLHSGVGEIAAVVTRYYGGVKLGKGGLVRAYGGCVQAALATLPRVRQVQRQRAEVRVGYADVDALRRLLAEHDAEVLDEAYGEEVRYTAALPTDRVDAFAAALREVTAGRGAVVRGE